MAIRSNKKNILILCHDYRPPFLTLAGQSAKLFDSDEYEVTTVYVKGEPSEEVVEQSHAHEVIFFNLSNKQASGLRLRALYRLYQLHRRKHFAFAIAHRYQSLYTASHIPGLLVFGIHHDYIEYRRLARRLWVRFHQKRLCLLGVSDSVRDHIRKVLPQFPADQIQTLYNSIDPQTIKAGLMSREEALKELGLLSNEYTYVNIGRLVKEKDQISLIKAFALLAQDIAHARLVIMGKGPLLETLQALIVELNMQDRIVLLGHINEAYRYLHAFDCFVLSSQSESFGMVLLEAMIAKLPIVATHCGGIPETLGETAQLVTPGDVQALARAMKEVYETDAITQEELLKERVKRVLDHFTTQAVRAQFKALWKG